MHARCSLLLNMDRNKYPQMTDEQWNIFEHAADYNPLENGDQLDFDWDEFFRRYEVVIPVLDKMINN